VQSFAKELPKNEQEQQFASPEENEID